MLDKRSLRRASAVLLALASAAPAHSQEPAQPPAPVFGEKIEVVSVDVLVLDGQGNPVQGLTKDAFSISEEGKPQQITTFDAISFDESAKSEAAGPGRISSNAVEVVRPERSFMFVFDDLNMTVPNSERARKEIEKVLDKLSDGDQITVVPTSGGTWWSSRLPEGREDILAFLDARPGKRVMDLSAGRVSDYEAMQIYYGRDPSVMGVVARRWFQNGVLTENFRSESVQELGIEPGLPLIRAKATEVYTDATRRTTATLATIERAATSLGVRPGRKAVIVVSDGFFMDTTRPEFRDVVRAARQANAVLYYVDAKGQLGAAGSAPTLEAEFGRTTEDRDKVTTIQNFAKDAEGSESVALDTGGFALKGASDLAGGMERIVKESRQYYLLGYVSTSTKRDGKFRKIKVAVNRPGVDIRARKGYYAPSATDKAKPASEGLDPLLRAGLDSPFISDTIPLRLTSYFFGLGASGKAQVLLVGDVDLKGVQMETQADRRVGALETYVVVSPRDSGGNYHQEKQLDLSLPAKMYEQLLLTGVPVMRNFELPPGAYQARLLVRDRRSNSMGTVRHTFTVPEDKGLATSSPILTDAVQMNAGVETPIPIARRSFAAGARLLCIFDVYGASKDAGGLPKVKVAYVVRRKGGAVFVESAPHPVGSAPDGSISQKLVLSLKGAEAGEYEMVVSVVDELAGKTLVVTEPFEVGA